MSLYSLNKTVSAEYRHEYVAIRFETPFFHMTGAKYVLLLYIEKIFKREKEYIEFVEFVSYMLIV